MGTELTRHRGPQSYGGESGGKMSSSFGLITVDIGRPLLYRARLCRDLSEPSRARLHTGIKNTKTSWGLSAQIFHPEDIESGCARIGQAAIRVGLTIRDVAASQNEVMANIAGSSSITTLSEKNMCTTRSRGMLREQTSKIGNVAEYRTRKTSRCANRLTNTRW